jgi:hypothetical protein
VTRLTAVPLRSSLIQGNDKNLGPLSTPRLDSEPDYRGSKVPTSARSSIGVPGADGYPRAFTGFPDRNNGFLEACLLKTAQLVELQLHHSDEVPGTATNDKDHLIHRSC